MTQAEQDSTGPDETPEQRMVMAAWGLLANVSEGDWTRQTDEWHMAVVRWRDEQFHPWLGEQGTEVGDPPWADGPAPDPVLYVESELFVAGALSTLPPFDAFHPAWALPFARCALTALGNWDPTDA